MVKLARGMVPFIALITLVAGLDALPSGMTIAENAEGGAPVSLEAYDGLGVWIDIYDPWAFDKPLRTVNRAADHGVNTLFVETSNFFRPFAIYRADDMARLINAAHDADMQVVAWYLPGFSNIRFDFRRSMQAIHFHRNGAEFDSFGLDIENSDVKPQSLRSRRLIALSRRINANVPDSYPLGAIIPSPRGMQLVKGYWSNFPYAKIAPFYDVWLPMGYYTYRVNGYHDVYNYTALNTEILYDETGDDALPIHPIGGIANKSNEAETRAFVDAVIDDGLIGGGIYDMGLSSSDDWPDLERLSV